MLHDRGQVELIINDVVMPRLGGIGLVKALRQHGVATSVILMSGHAPAEDRTGVAESSIVAWLDKPPAGGYKRGRWPPRWKTSERATQGTYRR